MTQNQVLIEALFPIKEREWIIAHLASFDWDFTHYGPVWLCCDDEKVLMEYIGSGNHENTPIVILVLEDSRYPSVEHVIQRVQKGEARLYLERCCP